MIRLAPPAGIVIISRALRHGPAGREIPGPASFLFPGKADVMDRTALRQALLVILENNCGEPVERFDESMSLRADLGLDSVDMIGLSMEIQERFHLRLEPSDLEQVTSAGDLLDLLQARLSLRAVA